MLAIEAAKMGYRIHTFSPDLDSPTGRIAELEITASYEDLDAVRKFVSNVDVVTFEFENVPSVAAEIAAEYVPVRPRGSVLNTTQNRLREKTFLTDHGFPVTPFKKINSIEDLMEGLKAFNSKGILKTAGFGYDGKGQVKIDSIDKADYAYKTVEGNELILESFVDFVCELSIIGARGIDGSFAYWGPVKNIHQNHILDLSIAPMDLPPELSRQAVEIARGVLETLDVVGVLAVEMFLTKGGELLVNELAPRPHNSGHYTFDACVTSQFEQQLRAVCGLPLGSTQLVKPAAMVNLLGDLWPAYHDGEPNWAAALQYPNVKLHLYDKLEAKPGRKMGHITAMADSAEDAARIALAARRALTRS